MPKYEITKGAAYGLLILFVTVVTMFIIAIWFAGKAAESAKEDANRAIRESNQVMCQVLNYIALRQEASATPNEFIIIIQKMRSEYKCESGVR